jgi:hypothetical protein
MMSPGVIATPAQPIVFRQSTNAGCATAGGATPHWQACFSGTRAITYGAIG